MRVLTPAGNRRVKGLWFGAADQEAAPSTRSAGRMRWLPLVLLGGYLLFCHGCHGDEDNELFASAGFGQRFAVPNESVPEPCITRGE